MKGEDAILIVAWQQVCCTEDSVVNVYSEKVSQCDRSDEQGATQKRLKRQNLNEDTEHNARNNTRQKMGFCRHLKSVRPCKPTQC